MKTTAGLRCQRLHIAGWYDVFLSGTVRNYQGLRDGAGTEQARRAQKLIIGPWYHIPWQPLVNENPLEAAAAVVDDFQIAFFDAQLKGKASSLLDSPVTIWLLGEERWVDLDDWPPAGVSEYSVYLHSDGRANSRFGDGWLSEDAPEAEHSDIFTYDPGIPNRISGGHSCCFPDVAPMGPADQEESEVWHRVLVYTTEPLQNDVLIIGEPYVVLYAATNAVDTDWTARLCVVDEDDLSVNVQEGIVRARFRESLEEPTLLEPGRIYEYRIDLGPVGIRVPAGHRIRLDISSSDFPQWDRNMNTGGPTGAEGPAEAFVATQIVMHDAEHPSRLVLPVMSAV